MRSACLAVLIVCCGVTFSMKPGRDLLWEAKKPGVYLVGLPEGWQPAVPVFTVKTSDGEAVVLNAKKASRCVLRLRRVPPKPCHTSGGWLYDILVIAPQAFCKSAVLRRYIAAKEKAGFKVRVVATEEILSGATGDPADRLLRWLRTEWRRANFLFLLLIGTPDPYERPVSLELIGLPYRYRTTVASLVMAGGWEEYDTDCEIKGSGWIALTGEHLRFGRGGVLSSAKIFSGAAGEMELAVVRRDDAGWRFVARQKVRFEKGWSFPTLPPLKVKKGDVLAFRVLKGKLRGWRAEKVLAYRLRLEGGKVELGKPLKALPAVMVRGFAEKQTDRVGTLPMKLTYPMGTYASLNLAYNWDQHYRAVPTDACYAAPDGQWDADGDGFFAESLYKIAHWDDVTGFYEWGAGDGDVVLPVLGVGRIPFDVGKERGAVEDVLERAMSVKVAPRLLVAAESLSPITTLEGLPAALKDALPGWRVQSIYAERVFWGREPVPSRGFDVTITKEQIKRDPCIAADILTDTWLEFMPGVVLVASHGNRDLAGYLLPLRRPPLKVGKPFYGWFKRLRNAPPVVLVTTGCNTAQPERYFLGRRAWLEGGHNWEERPCILEEALRRFAVCAFGNTRGAWFTHGWLSPRDGGCVSLSYYITQNLANGQPAGIALRNAICRYATLFSAQFTDAQNILSSVLYGDPTYSLNGDVPVVAEAELPQARTGYPYSSGITIRGPKAAKIEVSGLPPGLKWDSQKRLISGIPTMAGKFFVRIRVEASSGAWAVYDVLLRVVPSRRGGKPLALKRLHSLRLAPNSFRRKGFMATPSQLVSERSWSARCFATLKYPIVLLGSAKLTFSARCDLEPSADIFCVEASRDGKNWLPLFIKCSNTFKLEPVTEDIKPRWIRYTVDLSDLVGKAVLLRFRYEANEVFNREPREGVQIKEMTLEGEFCIGTERGGEGAKLLVQDGVPVGFVSGLLAPPEK